MKTLQEIKNNYAQEQGYDDWNELRHWRDISEVADGYMNEICIRAQKAALKKAAENVKIKRKDNWFDLQLFEDWSEIDRTSITNPENLIR